MTKVLVLGWDGADYEHLEQIDLEFFDSLDYSGKLLPEKIYRGIPIDSGTAWTTITTGLEVEKHGFISISNSVKSKRFLKATKLVGKHVPSKRLRTYFYYGANKLVNVKEKTPRSSEVSYKRIWDYVNGKTLTLGVPLTYPAYEHNGVMLSGIPAPLDAEELTSYPEEYDFYRRRYNAYYYMDGEKSPLEDEEQPNLEKYRERIYELNNEAFNVVEDLADDEDFELIFAVFPVLDDMMHSTDEEDEWSVIEETYSWIDEKSEELVDAIDPDTVIVVSDHGMMPVEKSLNPMVGEGVKMDHDSMNGIWASDSDLGIEQQKDLVPTILELFGSKEFNPEKFE